MYSPYTKRLRERQSRAFNAACKPAPKFEVLTLHQGMKIIVTDHAREQMQSRYNMCIDFQKKFFMDALDGLKAQNFKPDYYNHEVFVYSQKHRQGFIAAFRRDFRSENDQLSMVIVTVYPMGRRKGLHSDTKTIFV